MIFFVVWAVRLAEDILERPIICRDDISEMCKWQVNTSSSLSFLGVVCGVANF